ncbi:MAG: hypothetical protein ACJAVK_000594 [Akkermansiaceae bacterium]|jgi:hypothetical protein
MRNEARLSWRIGNIFWLLASGRPGELFSAELSEFSPQGVIYDIRFEELIPLPGGRVIVMSFISWEIWNFDGSSNSDLLEEAVKNELARELPLFVNGVRLFTVVSTADGIDCRSYQGIALERGDEFPFPKITRLDTS